MIVKPLYTPRYVPTGNEVAVFETSKGTIRVRLFGKDAPVTVGNFVELAQKGFYDHQNFHGRVEGDVVVGGCPVTRPLRPQQVRMAVREQLRGVHPGIGDAGYVIADEWEANPRTACVSATTSKACAWRAPPRFRATTTCPKPSSSKARMARRKFRTPPTRPCRRSRTCWSGRQ